MAVVDGDAVGAAGMNVRYRRWRCRTHEYHSTQTESCGALLMYQQDLVTEPSKCMSLRSPGCSSSCCTTINIVVTSGWWWILSWLSDWPLSPKQACTAAIQWWTEVWMMWCTVWYLSTIHDEGKMSGWAVSHWCKNCTSKRLLYNNTIQYQMTFKFYSNY